MNCPNCGDPHLKYNQKRPTKSSPGRKTWKRTDFRAECKKCGFKGEVKDIEINFGPDQET